MLEFDFINRCFRPLAGDNPFAVGLRDDAAYVPVPLGQELVISTDMLLAGVHFFADDPPRLIAQKALRVNLSDLAAKGATPLGYSLALAVPKNLPENFWPEFCAGLAADQQQFGLSLLGGDTTASPQGLCITVTIYGTIPIARRVLRADAKIGDDVYVTGELGLAALGLYARQNSIEAPEFIDRYHLPQPRMRLIDTLADVGLVHAAMDISDGLLADLGHIVAASSVGAEISLPLIPQSTTTQEFIKKYRLGWVEVLAGGDDYELLFTTPAKARTEVFRLAQTLAITTTRIGVISANTGIIVRDADQNPITISKTGYQHYF